MAKDKRNRDQKRKDKLAKKQRGLRNRAIAPRWVICETEANSCYMEWQT